MLECYQSCSTVRLGYSDLSAGRKTVPKPLLIEGPNDALYHVTQTVQLKYVNTSILFMTNRS